MSSARSEAILHEPPNEESGHLLVDNKGDWERCPFLDRHLVVSKTL